MIKKTLLSSLLLFLFIAILAYAEQYSVPLAPPTSLLPKSQLQTPEETPVPEKVPPLQYQPLHPNYNNNYYYHNQFYIQFRNLQNRHHGTYYHH
jgi:hypothetical protein